MIVLIDLLNATLTREFLPSALTLIISSISHDSKVSALKNDILRFNQVWIFFIKGLRGSLLCTINESITFQSY